MRRPNDTYIKVMSLHNEIISKAQVLLQRMEKIGVGVEAGGPVEHQTGGFGQVKDENAKCQENEKYLTHCIENEQGFRRDPRANEMDADTLTKLDTEVIQGGFGTTEEGMQDDNFYMPEMIQSDDGCLDESSECQQKHALSVKAKKRFDGPLDAGNHLAGDR